MTRQRIVNRRRKAGPRPAPREIPMKAPCTACGKVRYIVSGTEVCQKCFDGQPPVSQIGAIP